MRLVPTAQSCTLVKCKPGKTYNVVLVALTCSDDVKKERKRKVTFLFFHDHELHDYITMHDQISN